MAGGAGGAVMTAPDWRDHAAMALDHTHAIGERGPRTFNAQLRVAKALDGIGALRVEDVRWLERVAREVASTPSPTS